MRHKNTEETHMIKLFKRFSLLLTLVVLCAVCLVGNPTDVHAKTKKTKYTISYNANSGKKAPKKKVVTSKKKKVSVKLSKSIPTKSGYVFKSWNTKKNGTGKSYKPGSKMTLTTKKKNVKLYAIWKRVVSLLKKAKSSSAPVVSSSPSNTSLPDPGSNGDAVSTMEVHFLDVGQGDATLIMCGGESMLIDAGDNSKGTYVQDYLQSKGVSKLKYLIGTHPDADHIGGIDVVITKFDIGTFLMPATSKDTKTYDDVIQAAKYKNLKITNPVHGTRYKLGSADFEIVSLNKDYGTAANDWSICIRLVNGNNSFLLVGDAEEESELDMVNSGVTLKSDVYKVAHHGSKTGTVAEFLNAVNPSYAVISCGEGNDYGHPHTGVLTSLRQKGVKVFRTDEQGTIVATSDGTTIKWNASPSTSWKAGEPKGSASANTDQSGTYVLNTNSKVFHHPDCSAVSKMSERNKQIYKGNRESLITDGYNPCGYCKP